MLSSIGEVAAEEWDELGGAVPFAGHRWLRLAETVLAEHRPRYVLVRRGGTLVAAAVGSLEHRLQNPALDARLGRLLRRRPFLHVALPMTASTGLLGDETAELLGAVLAYVRRERLLFCVVDHLPASFATPPGYCKLGWLPETRLDLKWASFEEYLAFLPSKKRREIRRTQRRAVREGIVVEPAIPEDAFDAMVADVTRRHGGTRHYLPGLFRTAATALGPDLTLLAARRDGAPAGCIALLRSGDDLVVRWIGRDYSLTTGTAVYHALLTACVRSAIGSGARTLRFGAAAYSSKKQFGVELEPRIRLFAARSGAVTWLMGRVGRRFDPPSGDLEKGRVHG